MRCHAEDLVPSLAVDERAALRHRLEQGDVAMEGRRPEDTVLPQAGRGERTEEVELMVSWSRIPPQRPRWRTTSSCHSVSSVAGASGNTRVIGTGSGRPSRRATCVATADHRGVPPPGERTPPAGAGVTA